MPVSINTLGHSFSVSSVNKTFSTDIFLNIIKRREQIIYRTVIPPESINISFISSGTVSSSLNLSIADRSTSLDANRATNISPTTFSGAKTFTIDTENFVVTDVFTTSISTLSPVPLFYKHILDISKLPRVSEEDLSLASGIRLISVTLLDQFLQPIKVSEKFLDESQGIVYNNLLSEFKSSSDYTVYYVKYTINNNGEIRNYLDLLDNVPTYRLATFEDLDETLAIIQDGRKVYLLEETTTGFTVTLPVVGTYSFKPLSTARINILKPVGTSALDSWFVRVRNGKFFTNIDGTLYKYSIAEFLNQAFDPEPPIKISQLEESTILTTNLIKLDRENIHEDSEAGLFINININDSNNNGLFALTTDPDNIGEVSSNGEIYIGWDLVNRAGIRSIDHRTGVIDLEGIKLKDNYKIISTYYFQEENFEFTKFNFNPISNSDALSHQISLFIDPDTASTEKDQTLYFLKINKAGQVIESDWPDFNNSISLYDPNGDDIGVPLYYESIPSFITPTGDEKVFVDDFTVETSGVVGVPNFLILGDITVAEALSSENINTFDSRRRGGGVIDEQISAATELNPEVKWFWDIGSWDGTPYPGNASYMAEVPVGVLKNTVDGIFTQQQVRDIINRHTAYGVYPVSRAYGVEVLVSGIIPGESSLTLQWYSYV